MVYADRDCARTSSYGSREVGVVVGEGDGAGRRPRKNCAVQPGGASVSPTKDVSKSGAHPPGQAPQAALVVQGALVRIGLESRERQERVAKVALPLGEQFRGLGTRTLQRLGGEYVRRRHGAGGRSLRMEEEEQVGECCVVVTSSPAARSDLSCAR